MLKRLVRQQHHNLLNYATIATLAFAILRWKTTTSLSMTLRELLVSKKIRSSTETRTVVSLSWCQIVR
jgi:hypothetical protein